MAGSSLTVLQPALGARRGQKRAGHLVLRVAVWPSAGRQDVDRRARLQLLKDDWCGPGLFL